MKRWCTSGLLCLVTSTSCRVARAAGMTGTGEVRGAPLRQREPLRSNEDHPLLRCYPAATRAWRCACNGPALQPTLQRHACWDARCRLLTIGCDCSPAAQQPLCSSPLRAWPPQKASSAWAWQGCPTTTKGL